MSYIIGRFSCLVSSCSVVHPVPPGHLEHEDDEDEAEEDVEPGEGEADVDDLPAHPVRHSRRGNQVLEAPGLLQQGHQGYTTHAHDLPSPPPPCCWRTTPTPPPPCCWRMPPPCPPQLHWTAAAPSSLLRVPEFFFWYRCISLAWWMTVFFTRVYKDFSFLPCCIQHDKSWWACMHCILCKARQGWTELDPWNSDLYTEFHGCNSVQPCNTATYMWKVIYSLQCIVELRFLLQCTLYIIMICNSIRKCTDRW